MWMPKQNSLILFNNSVYRVSIVDDEGVYVVRHGIGTGAYLLFEEIKPLSVNYYYKKLC